MKAPSAILFFFFFAGCTHGPSPAQPAPGYGEEREFVGMFIENSQESIFFPCGIRLADDGWWLRFEPNVRADMVRYQYKGPGFPTSTHDIRVRGRLSPPGSFGTGFHTRELAVSRLIERESGVSLRGGCFCNPGAAEAAFGFPYEATARCLRTAATVGFTIGDFSQCLGPGIPVGAVRASLGIPSNRRDVDRAIEVIESLA